METDRDGGKNSPKVLNASIRRRRRRQGSQGVQMQGVATPMFKINSTKINK